MLICFSGPAVRIEVPNEGPFIMNNDTMHDSDIESSRLRYDDRPSGCCHGGDRRVQQGRRVEGRAAADLDARLHMRQVLAQGDERAPARGVGDILIAVVDGLTGFPPSSSRLGGGQCQQAPFGRVTAATHRNDSSGCSTSYMIQGLVRWRRCDRGAGSDRRAVVNDDVLLKFLGKGLINVGGDDDKLEHLRQTAADLAGILEETPAKACPFALVAFDPHVPTSDPTIVEVEDALRKRWQTYVNTFAGTPVTVFRAMLLDALITACGRNDMVAAAIVASARNVLPFMEVGDEQEIWANIVADIERSVEERAEREWATPASISVPDIKFGRPATDEIRISSKKVNTTSLRQKLMAAAGPHFSSPDRGTGGNPG